MDPVGPVNDALRLLPKEMLIGGMIQLLDVLATENKCLDGPVSVLDLIHLGSDRSHNTKVVASALEGPPEIGLLVDGLERSISQDNVERDPLICDDTVMALKPAMSTTKAWTHIANALTCSGHWQWLARHHWPEDNIKAYRFACWQPKVCR